MSVTSCPFSILVVNIDFVSALQSLDRINPTILAGVSAFCSVLLPSAPFLSAADEKVETVFELADFEKVVFKESFDGTTVPDGYVSRNIEIANGSIGPKEPNSGPNAVRLKMPVIADATRGPVNVYIRMRLAGPPLGKASAVVFGLTMENSPKLALLRVLPGDAGTLFTLIGWLTSGKPVKTLLPADPGEIEFESPEVRHSIKLRVERTGDEEGTAFFSAFAWVGDEWILLGDSRALKPAYDIDYGLFGVVSVMFRNAQRDPELDPRAFVDEIVVTVEDLKPPEKETDSKDDG